MTLEIILNGQYKLDVNDEINVLLTYQVGDVRNFLNRNSNFSKTISIAGTARNNQAFQSLFDVTNDGLYNPNKKASVNVISGGISVFNGYLQVNSIKIDFEKKIDYECTIFSEIADMFTNLGQLQLNQISFPEYTHTYDIDAITGSWETHIYINGQQTPFQMGRGYVYPYIDYGKGLRVGTAVSVEFFKPCLYAKTVWDKIFSESGYSYKSDFINTDYFKSLIVAPDISTLLIPDSASTLSKCLVSQDDDNHILYSSTNDSMNFTVGQIVIPFENNSSLGNYDTGNNYNTTLYEYTVPYSGQYNIEANLNLDTQLYDSSLAISATTGFNVTAQIAYNVNINCIRSGATIILDTQYSSSAYSQFITVNGQGIGDAGDNIPNFDLVPSPYLYAGDIIQVVMNQSCKVTLMEDIQSNTPFPAPAMNIVQRSPSFFKIELLNNDIWEGMEIDFQGYLSQDLCTDYILSVSKMFNLYFEFDRTDSTCLIIEPREQFYNGDVIDWTYKLDRDNELEVFPMSEINASNYLFTYKSDTDYYNNDYNTKTGNVYGQYQYWIDNDFIDATSQEEIDVIFAPTPLVNETLYDSATYPVPKIISTVYSMATNGTITPESNNGLRILFYGGMLPCDEWNIINNNSGLTQLGTYTTNETYPYCGYLDNPNNPTEDLNFGFPEVYYYTRQNLTFSNLFNKWWSNSLEEITDKSAKLITGYFKLNTNDIANLSFRNIIYLDSQYWIINKISDYNAVEDNLTQVELLKLINYGKTSANVDVKQQAINLNIGNTSRTLNDGTTVGFGAVVNGGIQDIQVNNLITGGNTQGGTSARNNIIAGNLNLLGSGAINNVVIGSENTINGKSNKILVVGDGNSSGTESTAIIVGNQIPSSAITSNAINVGSVNLLSSQPDSGFILIDGSPTVQFTPSGITINGSITQNINFITAGRDIIADEFPQYTPVSFISAGRDTLRGFGSYTVVNLISAGRNTTL